MTVDEAREVLVSALRMKRERVVDDNYENKLSARQAIDDVVDRLSGGSQDDLPSATLLTAMLGNPDDKELREALSVWNDR